MHIYMYVCVCVSKCSNIVKKFVFQSNFRICIYLKVHYVCSGEEIQSGIKIFLVFFFITE